MLFALACVAKHAVVTFGGEHSFVRYSMAAVPPLLAMLSLFSRMGLILQTYTGSYILRVVWNDAASRWAERKYDGL